jgi:hypothetical protein
VTIELRTASADDWRAWRSVRLAALTDAPAAFCSRLEEWADAPEGRWRERLSIPGAIDLLAFDADGIAPYGHWHPWRGSRQLRRAHLVVG